MLCDLLYTIQLSVRTNKHRDFLCVVADEEQIHTLTHTRTHTHTHIRARVYSNTPNVRETTARTRETSTIKWNIIIQVGERKRRRRINIMKKKKKYMATHIYGCERVQQLDVNAVHQHNESASAKRTARSARDGLARATNTNDWYQSVTPHNVWRYDVALACISFR